MTHFDALLALGQLREGIPEALTSGSLYHGGSSAYRPLQNMVYAAEYAVFGVNGFGYQTVAFIA